MDLFSMNKINIQEFYDQDTATLTYVVFDSISLDAIVVDPVLDYTPASSKYSTESVDQVTEFINSKQLTLHYILETHAHADHLSGAQFLKDHFPDSKLGIGSNIKIVQQKFKDIFNFKDFNENGIQFDILLDENSLLNAGTLSIQTIFTPGHTPACVSYVINNQAVFTGDVLFLEDFGTGRCDFPGGSASAMYDSVMKLYELDDHIQVYVGHDYQPGGRSLRFRSCIKDQKESNIHINSETKKEDFVYLRENRDKTLKAPKLLLQSLQVNIDAGQLPKSEDNGMPYLKIPLKRTPKKN